MNTAALTLWFTLTTLLGPGVCCCSLSAAPLDTTGGRPARPDGAPKPAKSCCEHKLPAGTANATRAASPAPQQGQPKPGECPCESEKQATSLPPKGLAAAAVELLPSLDASLSADPFGGHLHAIASVRLAPETPFPLAGRNLLAAYSVLRC